ncbi:MAG TPA: hypothetical protein VLN61_09395 [Pseudolabrys sp.]|nr:hypothetical protein [Pseudolabrys sp.]
MKPHDHFTLSEKLRKLFLQIRSAHPASQEKRAQLLMRGALKDNRILLPILLKYTEQQNRYAAQSEMTPKEREARWIEREKRSEMIHLEAKSMIEATKRAILDMARRDENASNV